MFHPRVTSLIACPIVGALAFICVLANCPLATQAQSYDLVQLDLPVDNLAYAHPTDIDESGNVVGYYRVLETDLDVGFFYDRQTSSFTFAQEGEMWVDVNDLGGIVGGDQKIASIYSWIWSPKDSFNVGSQALYWSDPGAVPIALLPVPGDQWTAAGAINNLGLIVGLSYPEFPNAPAPVTAVVWQVTTGGISEPFPLPSLSGELFNVAASISEPNANGVCTIVGRCGDDQFGELETLVRWRVKVKNDGSLQLTEGPIAISPPTNSATGPQAANSQAFAVGRIEGDAIRVSQNGDLKFLRTFKINGNAADLSYASDVNESKDVVGYITVNALYGVHPGYRGALWRNGSTVVNLTNTVVLPENYNVHAARAINGSGEIAAVIGKNKKQNYLTLRPVILVPR